MTELETLERAKMYMEKLANGINPIDGISVSDDDVINNVRLSRCFFYVADVLRQVIENGGVNGQKKAKKTPFSLSAKQRESFEFSGTPIPISEVSKRLNALIEDENMSSITYNAVRDWLLSLDMLAKMPDENGKSAIRPTKQGEELGILLDRRVGLEGPYFVVVYNLAAQHFILDNLDAIIDFKNSKQVNQDKPKKLQPENAGKPWTKEDDEILCQMFETGCTSKEICNHFGRTKGAIAARLVRIGKIGERADLK